MPDIDWASEVEGTALSVGDALRTVLASEGRIDRIIIVACYKPDDEELPEGIWVRSNSHNTAYKLGMLEYAKAVLMDDNAQEAED